MPSTRQIDYIIVGQGLAGSCVAVQLLKLGRRILVIDQPRANSATRIAAGLFNPVTGKKMTKTWLADTIFPYLHMFYRDVEAKTGKSFFNAIPLYRPFISIEEQNEWMARSAEPGYSGYVERIFTSPAVPGVNDPFGGLLLKQCGYINTSGFMQAVRQWIELGNEFRSEDFDENLVSVDAEGIEYQGWKAKHLILCQGTSIGRWFGWLPVRALKGETITVRSEFDPPYIVNRGVYVVPSENKREFRVGATYDFLGKNENITDEARHELEDKFREIVSKSFEVADQQWGFRPTTPDRRPILGSHPENDRIVAFNGLGTKGVSLAPFFSEVLIQSLENAAGITKEADVNRYKSVYWNVPK